MKFILCAVKTTEDGIIKNEWNTTLNTECESLEGMEVDKVAVEEETKDIVEQLIAMMNHSAENAVRAVEEAKAEVDKEVGDFALKAQQALADVNNAGQTQTERVQSAGTTGCGKLPDYTRHSNRSGRNSQIRSDTGNTSRRNYSDRKRYYGRYEASTGGSR